MALVLLVGGLMFFLANVLSGAIGDRGLAMVILLPLLSNDPEYISALQHRLSQPVDLLARVGAIVAAGAMTYPFGRLLYRRET